MKNRTTDQTFFAQLEEAKTAVDNDERSLCLFLRPGFELKLAAKTTVASGAPGGGTYQDFQPFDVGVFKSLKSSYRWKKVQWFQGNKTATVVPRTFAVAIHEPYLTAMSKENLPGGFRNACLYPVDWGKALAKTEKYEQLQSVAVKRDCSQFRHTDKQSIYVDDATHHDHNDYAGDMSPSCQPAQKCVRHFLSWSVVYTDTITERSRVREKAGEWKKNELSNVRRRGRRQCPWHRKVEWRRNREIEWDEWKSEEKLRGAHFCRCKTGCATKRCGCRSNSEEGKCGVHCLCVNCCNK